MALGLVVRFTSVTFNTTAMEVPIDVNATQDPEFFYTNGGGSQTLERAMRTYKGQITVTYQGDAVYFAPTAAPANLVVTGVDKTGTTGTFTFPGMVPVGSAQHFGNADYAGFTQTFECAPGLDNDPTDFYPVFA